MSRAAVLIVGAGAVFAASAWLMTRDRQEGEGGDPFAFGLAELDQAAAPLFYEALSEVEQIVPIGPTFQEVSFMSEESNVAAFLRMIRYAEGTAGPDGYRTMFGGELFDTFADHPRRAITRLLGRQTITSTAAGAYQFLSTTWDDARRALGLPDFSPESQDAAAVWLIRRRGALADVRAGRFDAAVAKCAREWASLPGSPYGQPVKSLDQVRAAYENAGGAFA